MTSEQTIEAACEHRDQWFSRSMCPEPCGTMHTYCTDCGKALDFCPIEATARREAPPNVATLAQLIAGTADAYSAEHDHVVVLDDVVAEAIAAAVWDRYLAGAS